MSTSSHAVELVREPPPHGRPSEHALLVQQLPVIREMLGTLDTLTIAGQRHVMQKVVDFVDTKTRVVAARMSHRNRATLFDLLTQLGKESERLVPDSARFARQAESLITLLGTVR